MCIRDRFIRRLVTYNGITLGLIIQGRNPFWKGVKMKNINVCLLYTSDAADERSSVDLGGRRIIKKKKTIEIEVSV